MIDNLTYIHLHTNTMNPCSMDKAFGKMAKTTWLCSGCNYPKPDTRAVEVMLQGTKIDDPPLNFVYGFGVPVAHKDFLFSFGEDVVRRDLYLGPVLLSGGQLLNDWVTFRGRYRPIIRGRKNVAYRQCGECGRDVYFATGTRYLCPAPPADAVLYESDLFGLIVPEYLIDVNALRQWRRLVLDKLPVFDIPKDGLPPILSKA